MNIGYFTKRVAELATAIEKLMVEVQLLQKRMSDIETRKRNKADGPQKTD